MAAQSFPPTRPILLTRAAAASERFAVALRESFGAGARVVISPLMCPVYLTPTLPPGPFDAVILTSETGAEAARRISAEGADLPRQAFCVGDRTARVAAAAGFHPQSAQGDADALVRVIVTAMRRGRLLHLRGHDSRGDVVQRLRTAGLEAQEAVVYDQMPCDLTFEAKAMLAAPEPVVLPLFSPRSADLVAQSGPIGAP